MSRNVFLILALLCISPAFAQAPKCSFGSSPLSTIATIVPGGEVTIPWSVYNYYGDRPTFVDFRISENNWSVKLSNVKTMPWELMPNSSNSSNSVSDPVNGARIPVDDVYVNIKAPLNASINNSNVVVVTANAYCFSDLGVKMPGIQTSLKINLTVVKGSPFSIVKTGEYFAVPLISIAALALVAVIIIVRRKINNRRKTRN